MCKPNILKTNQSLTRFLTTLLFLLASALAWGQVDLEITQVTPRHNGNDNNRTNFIVIVRNLSSNTATNVVVTDDFPGRTFNGTNYKVSHGSVQYSSGTTLTWEIPYIAGGGMSVLMFGTTGNPAGTNTASLTSLDQTDTNSGNNTSVVSSTVVYNPTNYKLTKIVDNPTPFPGQNVTFTIQVQHINNNNDSRVVTDLLPPGYDYVSHTASNGNGNYNESTGEWTVNPGWMGTQTLTITAEVLDNPDDIPAAYFYNNFAYVGGSNAAVDLDISDNLVIATVNPITTPPAGEADLVITKSGSRQSYSGDIGTFTIAVTNNGPDDAADIMVTDELAASWTFPSPYDNYMVTDGTVTYTPANKKFEWEIDVLPVGETVYFTFTVNNIGDGNNQNWHNTATAVAPEYFDENMSNNTTTVTANQVSKWTDMEVTKDVSPTNPYIGENVVFTITATRIAAGQASQSADNVRVLDLLPSGYAYVSHTASAGTYDENTGIWTIGTINNNTARTLEITATALASGEYENKAVLLHDSPDPDVTNQIATAVIDDPIPDLTATNLSITKDVNESNPPVDSNVIFTIEVENLGDNDATGVVVTDVIPSGYEFVSSPGSTYDAGTKTVTRNIGNLAVFGTASFTITAKVLGTGTYVNTASVTHDGNDPVPGNNSDTASVTPVFPVADLEITNMEIDPSAPTVGNNVVFTIEVKNNGPDPASGVTVAALLPSGFQYVSSTPGVGTYNSGTGVWTIGSLVDQQTTTLSITATVKPTGNYTLNAEISGDADDPDIINNESQAGITNTVDLAITKDADDTTPGIGDPVTFTITVENVGANDATGVVVKDVIPSGYDYVTNDADATYDAPTRTVTWNVGNLNASASDSFTITANARAGGIHNNTATVSADQGDTNAANNSDSASVTPDLGSAVDLGVTQSVDEETPNISGNVTFTITAENFGPNPATGVIVKHLLANGLEYVNHTASNGDGNYNPATGTWTIGPMAYTATATLEIEATVLGAEGAAYLSIAEITGNEAAYDNVVTNNNAYSILSPVGQTFYPCDVNAETPAFYDDFGSGASPYAPELEPGRTNMIYVAGPIEDGEYTVTKNAQLGAGNWQNITDPSGDPDGYFMLVNADYDPYEFFRTRITLSEEFCTNTRYNVNFNVINVNSEENFNYCSGDGGGYILPEIGYFVVNDKGEVLGAGTSGEIPYNATAQWYPQDFVFISGTDDEWIELVLFNKAPGGCGNDLAIDDITVYACMTPPIRLEMIIDNEQLEVCGGETVTLTVDYTPGVGEDNYLWPPEAWGGESSDVEYQWQRSDDGINYTDLSGETGDTYIIENFQQEDQAYYRMMYAQGGNIEKVFCRFPSAQFYPVFNATPVIPPIKIENDGPPYVCGTENIPGGTLQLYTDYDTSAYVDPVWGPEFYLWESSDENVATIDPETGLITAVDTGITTITYTVSSPKGTCISSETKEIGVFADCPSCEEEPTGEGTDVVSPVGISTLESQLPGWPGNVPNGFIVLESKDKGFVITRVANTTATTISAPQEGMLVYSIADKCIKLYNGSDWHCIEQECDEEP